ncbi:MAG TPA: multidrug transporter [Fastidiosipila sp.]|nr:multidrug transporter [Fastidiosipila sp.]
MKQKRHIFLEEDGIGTLEVVIIIAVLLAVALIFRQQLMDFANQLIARVFNFSILEGL